MSQIMGRGMYNKLRSMSSLQFKEWINRLCLEVSHNREVLQDNRYIKMNRKKHQYNRWR
jgi:hypothetical protein